MEDSVVGRGKQASGAVAQELGQRLEGFLGPLVEELDRRVDKRLVRTLVQLVAVIIMFRQRAHGLLLSELGGYLLTAEQAPAGTKRISNLLRSEKWSYRLIEQFLWEQAEARVQALEREGQAVLALWDESVLEKPESIALEGLCAVRSRKAARLKRIRRGYYNPPGGRPICVPGMNWLGLLIIGRQGPPTLACLRWWTSRGKFASAKWQQEVALLHEAIGRWHNRVLHIFDRGFATSTWLASLFGQRARFVMRWKKGNKLTDANGQSRKAWEIVRGKRSWGQRLVWDAKRQCERKVGLYATTVNHPEHPKTLWLVVARRGAGHEPWYLLTTEPILSTEDALRIVRAYARRWQIEMAWRYCKSELAFESPRSWTWHRRLKLLLIATLAFAFLLSLLDPLLHALAHWLLRFWCHRTGKRSRETPAPLYRLRSALSRLWLAFPQPPPRLFASNSG